MFIAISFTKDGGAFSGMTVDLRAALSQFLDVITNWAEKESYSEQYRLRISRIPGSQLPKYAVDPEVAGKKRARTAGKDRCKPMILVDMHWFSFEV